MIYLKSLASATGLEPVFAIPFTDKELEALLDYTDIFFNWCAM